MENFFLTLGILVFIFGIIFVAVYWLSKSTVGRKKPMELNGSGRFDYKSEKVLQLISPLSGINRIFLGCLDCRSLLCLKTVI